MDIPFNMKKLLFVITTMGGGGAERIIAYLCNYFSEKEDIKVELLLLRSEGNTYLHSISEKVNICNLNIKGRLRWNVLTIVNFIRNLKPDICFFGLDGLNILMAPFLPFLKRNRTLFIVRETNVLSSMWGKTLINRLPYKLFYNRYDKIICQSKDMAKDLIENWYADIHKVSIINNPVDTDIILRNSTKISDSSIGKEYYVCSGRLAPQKGFDILIEHIHTYNQKYRDNPFPYTIVILGEGSERHKLEQLLQKYDLSENILLPGRIENPFPIIKKAKGFILSSNFEGFPNVLLEANALGIPVFANKCPGGINEIIIEGINGYTADFSSFEDFSIKLRLFMSTNFNNTKIKELNFKRYDKSIILPKYSELIFN